VKNVATDEVIANASYEFWGVFSDSFPEVTSGDSQLSGEDRAALAIWRNGDPGDEPVQRLEMTLTPEWDVSQERISQAVLDGIKAAGVVLFDGEDPPPVPPEVVAQLDSCAKHVLYFNPPRANLNKKPSSGMGV